LSAERDTTHHGGERVPASSPTRKPSQVADPDDVAEFAKSLSDAKLLCRINNRHIADPRRSAVHHPTKNDNRYVLEGPCIICDQPVKRRYDEFFGRVTTGGPTVDYDDDYLMPRGSGRIDARGRQALVGEFMQRAGAVPKGKRKRKPRESNVTPIRSEAEAG
jgi:hypothetical protein